MHRYASCICMKRDICIFLTRVIGKDIVLYAYSMHIVIHTFYAYDF